MSKENLLQRRQFLGRVTKGGIVGGLIATPFGNLAGQPAAEENRIRGDHRFLTKPYLQAPEPDSICINWITA